MVIYEKYATSKKLGQLIRAYSDSGYYIKNEDNVLYADAIDPESAGRTYTETSIIIEDDIEE